MSDFDLDARLNDFFDATATYLFPPITILKYLKMALNISSPEENAGFRPEKRDPKFISIGAKLINKFCKIYFRTSVRGVNKLPEKGAGLIVGNHNGGLVPIETFITAGAIINNFGSHRPLYGLGHDFLFREPTLGNILERMGALRAHPKAAKMAFEQDGMVIVYPGGDVETFRPFKNRDRIDFGGRKGFIRLSIREQVPIYPCVSVGVHEMFYVITRGEKIAEKLNLKKKLRTGVFPIVFSLPWGITTGFLPYLPLPSKIIIEFLDPITWPELKPEDSENEEIVQRCYNEVTRKMQLQLTLLSSERKHPVIG
jgi:1-acyl-sn-glycerol-3-phosphate acyltransferase